MSINQTTDIMNNDRSAPKTLLLLIIIIPLILLHVVFINYLENSRHADYSTISIDTTEYTTPITLTVVDKYIKPIRYSSYFCSKGYFIELTDGIILQISKKEYPNYTIGDSYSFNQIQSVTTETVIRISSP